MAKSDKALLVTSGGEALTKADVMNAINNEIVHLHETGDIQHASKTLSKLDDVEGVAGHAKARLLYGMNEWWKINKLDGESFGDYVQDTTPVRKITATRYVKVWQYVEDYTIPKDVAERPMRELVPIAQTISQGYDITNEGWKKIRLCSNSGELGEVLRKIKGKQPRKSARVIKLAQDGSLYGWKDNTRYFLGYLNVADAKDDVVLAEFIEKIKISAGIIED